MRPFDHTITTRLRPARAPLALVAACGVVVGLLTVAQAFAVGALVVDVVATTSGRASEPGSWHPAAWALIGITLGRAAFAWLGEVGAARAAGAVSTGVRTEVLSAARDGRLPPDVDDAAVVLLLTRGTASIEPYVTRYLPALVPAVVLPVATVVAIWSLDWLSGLIVVITLPLIPLFAALVGMHTRDRAAKQWQTMGVLSGHFLDVVTGLPTLVAHGRGEAQLGTIRTVTDRYRRATVHTLKIAFASSTVLELIATLSVALVAVCVGLRLAADNMDFRIALTVLLLAPEAYWPLRRVGAEFHSAAEGTAALAEVDRVLSEAAHPSPAHSRSDLVRPDGVRVALEGLGVGYPGAPDLITPVDLALPSTGLVAITGPSGCGKSTLLSTMRGLLAPRSGAVTVDGVDLAQVDHSWWREQVAWAPQRPWLLPASVADNVRVGSPTATDAEIWDVLDEVGLGEAVRALPDGLGTLLNEDGAGLSAGQRARLSIARVLVARRPIVLLDEPSAHLDEETEQILLRALTRLARTSLVIAVAHRPAVVAAADLELPLTPAHFERAADAGTVATAHASPEHSASLDSDSSSGDAAPRRADEPGDFTRRLGQRTATLLGALSSASGVALTATAGWLITRASEHPPVLYLMVAIVGVRTFGLARPALRHAERLLSHDVVLRALAERRAQVYAQLVPLVPGRLGPRRGDLLTSVVDDVDSLLDDQLRVKQPLVTTLLVGLGCMTLTAFLDPGIAVVVTAVALSGAAAFVLTRALTKAVEPRLLAARAALSIRTEEFVPAREEFAQWQAADPAIAAILRDSDDLTAATRRSVSAIGLGRAIATLASGVGVVAVAWSAPSPGTTISSAMLALCLLLPLALADVTVPLADAGALATRTRAARQRLSALSRLLPAVSDPTSPAAPPDGHVMGVEDLSAAWSPESDASPNLSPVSFDLTPGTRLGIVGPSGSGKSTLAACLVRFLDPRTGQVTIDGADLRDLRLADLRERIGLVDDDPHIFASSLAENVRLARPEATDSEVHEALTRAHLGSLLASLDHGLHGVVGTGGRALSGGERARVALARAILADRDVLILDEPTAHLDTATAEAVAADFLSGEARPDRSLVWITHSRVGLDRMDRVLRLQAPVGDGPPSYEQGLALAR